MPCVLCVMQESVLRPLLFKKKYILIYVRMYVAVFTFHSQARAANGYIRLV